MCGHLSAPGVMRGPGPGHQPSHDAALVSGDSDEIDQRDQLIQNNYVKMSQTTKRKLCEIADNRKMESMTEVQSNGAVSLFRLAMGVIKVCFLLLLMT